MKHTLKDYLAGVNITQKELAEKSGLSEVGLSKIINSGNATESSLKKIAEALNVEMDEFCTKDIILKAKFGSDKTPLKLGALELPCYVLENGMRVFSGRGMQKAIGSNSKSGTWLSNFIASEAIKPYLMEVKAGETCPYEQMQSPIQFYRNDAGGSQPIAYGYEATLLIDLCDAIIKAGETGYEIPVEYVRNANVIIRAVAKTGIIALVDEATGYDKEKTRAKDALQTFLNQFLQEEAAKWVKTFDDQFFEDLYKMRGWNWNYTSKKPGVVGIWINNIVYQRLAPGLDKLNELNPKNANGNRSHKHHQFLSRDIGLPRLKQYLEAVHAIAIISRYNWNQFIDNLNRAYPQQHQQLTLDFELNNE